MKNKAKEFIKKYLIGFALGVLSVGIVVVYAETYFPSNQTTYDNSVSELESTNVQDAIDELYGVCFPPTGGDQILDNVDIVTSGDGLYKDEYEADKYIYKGANPNNYITFNNEEAGWRIISIENDGTIKIIKGKILQNNTYDTSNKKDWARPATLNTYLNNTYYNSLTQTAKGQIVAHNFNIGEVTANNNDLSTQIKNEQTVNWFGKIGLLNVSEYLRVNSNKNNCKSIYLNNTNKATCVTTNWIYAKLLLGVYTLWTLTPSTITSTERIFIAGNNEGEIYPDNSLDGFGSVYPVLYLSPKVKITGGIGTQSDPYRIE